LTLALKYRPRRFEDLIAQETVVKTLAYALNQNKLSNAYLFSGLRGSGKTSTARIFSKAMLCSKGPTSSPCEECENCKMANQNSHLDIIEMDAASNRKIDDIRELIEQSHYKPAVGRFKIFIIDEVHMLTKEAFNALLKTLEEPPEFVKFILATTDPLKLPATIISRTQHFRFKKIPTPSIISHLEKILKLEGVEYEEMALKIIARSGGGSLRDTLTLLDQAIAFGKGRVTQKDVVEMLGLIDPKELEELIELIVKGEKERVLEKVEELSQYEARSVIEEMLLYLKEKFLEGELELPLMLYERFFKILSGSKELLQVSGEDSLVLTLTFLKMVEATKLKRIEELIQELEEEIPAPSQEPNLFSLPQKSPKKSTPKSFKSPKEKFELLIQKLEQKDEELGRCFKESITFLSFEKKVLRWRSEASVECKKILKESYPAIKHLVQEIFGIDTIIKSEVAKTKAPQPLTTTSTAKTQNITNDTPRDLANDPIIKKATQLFGSKKLVIKNITPQEPKSS